MGSGLSRVRQNGEAAERGRGTKVTPVNKDEQSDIASTSTEANSARSLNSTSKEDVLQIKAKKGFREKRRRPTTRRMLTDANMTWSKLVSRMEAPGPKGNDAKKRVSGILRCISLFPSESAFEMFDKMSLIRMQASEVLYKKGDVFPYFIVAVEGSMRYSSSDSDVPFANECALLEPVEAVEDLCMKTDGILWAIDKVQFQRATVELWKNRVNLGESLLHSITEIPSLQELPQESREAIAMALQATAFEEGDYLMRQGEQGNTMYFIEDGEVAIRKGENVIALRKRGDYIGEGALLDDEADDSGGLRSASAVAKTFVKCLALDRETFREHMGSMREMFEFNLCMRVLRSLAFTKHLTESKLSVLVSLLVEYDFPAGSKVVRQGEPGDTFYILKEGTLECILSEKTEASVTLNRRVGTLLPGDYFGEGALLTDSPRRCKVVVAGDSNAIVWALDRKNFNRIVPPEMRKQLDSTFEKRADAGKTEHKSVDWGELERVRTLGSGSYGTVDLVRHVVTGETFALKRLRKATVVAKKQQRFVKNERDLLKMCHSPFIVNLVSTFNREDAVYMLMEVCLGGELYTIMRHAVEKSATRQENSGSSGDVLGCFQVETQARFFVACTVLALEHIHSKGVVHRDVKPENLMIADDGYLKLVDFGFSKRIEGERTYSICGTPQYLAPEVYKRCGHSFGVDYWALGVLAYEMSSGYSPFHTESNNSWDCYIEISKYENFYPNIQFPQEFPKSLVDLLLRLLNPNPSKRYGSRRATSAHLKAHQFFGDTDFSFSVDWNAIETKAYKLPKHYRPKNPTSGMDGLNFEECEDRHQEDSRLVSTDKLEEASESWCADF